jgi:H+/Cl- antiporter ClcA
VAVSHLPGLPLVTAAGIGFAAMTAGLLRLPMTATLLATLFLGSDGLTILPLVIVAAVVSYAFVVRLAPPAPSDERTGATEPPAHGQVR